MTYEESLSKNITTNRTTRPDVPQISIRNPIDEDIFVNLIEILPNVDFALNGKLEIQINGVPVLDANSDSFRQYAKYPLSLGKKLNRGFKIDIFAWNGTNSDSLRCDFNIHLSSEQKQIPSVAIPLSQDEKNNALSDFETIFPLVTRTPASYTQLVDMKGYKKLSVLLSAVVYVDENSPTVLSGGDFGEGQNIVVDGDVTTRQTNGINHPTVGTKICEVDFRTNTSRLLKCRTRVEAQTANGINVAGAVSFYTKENIGDAWTLRQQTNYSLADGGLSVITQFVDINFAGTHTFRYVKVEFSRGGGNTNVTFYLYEVYDDALVGGSGSLSFEIFNSAGQWITYIPSSEFGTVVQGATAVSKILGDTIKSVSGQEYPLPSTQSRFRAKYTVANGGIKNAIDIVRVS